MPDKPVALVTGANQGIGLQIAKDLKAHGFTVLIGARDLERGKAAAWDVGGGAQAVQLDVTDQASIAAAAERIAKDFGRLEPAHPERGDLKHQQAARPIGRRLRQDDPPEQCVPR